MHSETLSIGGMTCAACSARVERALKKLEGVESAVVNLATEKATVVFDPRALRLSAIKEAVVKAGYQVLEVSSDTADEDKRRKEKEIKTLWIKFIVAASLGLPLLYIAMAPMIKWISLPFPKFLAPMHSPMLYGLVELALVIPIIIAGYRFYTVGFRTFCTAALTWIRSLRLGQRRRWFTVFIICFVLPEGIITLLTLYTLKPPV